MDFFNLFDNDDENLRMPINRAPRHYHARQNFEDDDDFVQRFRLAPATATYLEQRIGYLLQI